MILGFYLDNVYVLWIFFLYIYTFIFTFILCVDVLTTTYRRSRRSLYTLLSLGASTTLKHRTQALAWANTVSLGTSSSVILKLWYGFCHTQIIWYDRSQDHLTMKLKVKYLRKHL